MVRVLDRRFAEVDPAEDGHALLYWSMLSDVCHPSVGGTLLHFDPNSLPGWLEFRSDRADEGIGLFPD